MYIIFKYNIYLYLFSFNIKLHNIGTRTIYGNIMQFLSKNIDNFVFLQLV